ncbi:hypothetical protein BDV96DRAFT_142592 [Lophiotrema nucula]|uniref:Uncharacterized protein n=1 Tax=Lophiotrema nucula TaxID=690887 RepID=A0A6A5ZTY7_9PLEO|nr:hypothetical protein BDV96DRAFT_142592 [Lophiotrema nucula]
MRHMTARFKIARSRVPASLSRDPPTTRQCPSCRPGCLRAYLCLLGPRPALVSRGAPTAVARGSVPLQFALILAHAQNTSGSQPLPFIYPKPPSHQGTQVVLTLVLHRRDCASAAGDSRANSMLNSGHALPAGSYPTMNNIHPADPASISKLYKRELPDSQESFVSTASSTFAAPPLISSSSNVSNSTAADTDFTSPSQSSNFPHSQSQVERNAPPSPTQARAHNAQPHAPRIDTTSAPRTGDTAGSPMSLDSPGLVPGSKRTASGTVKNAVQSVNVSAAPVGAAHKRTKSTESGANPRIGELSAQLKTRLSYAMVKVQNGWERQSLEELEDAASQRGSPNSAQARSESSRPPFESPLTADRPRRPSGVSDAPDPMLMSPGQGSPPVVSRSTATTPNSFWRSIPRPIGNSVAVTGADGSVLAPAAEIGPRRKRRSSASYAPPPLLGAAQRKHYSDLSGMTPRTPNANATPRAGILRMPSQQAEKDAVDTLMFLSSPNASNRTPHENVQPSPLRSEMAPRRVMFENYPVKDKAGDFQRPVQAPNGPNAGFHRPDLPRQMQR